jgi:large repetitive protein
MVKKMETKITYSHSIIRRLMPLLVICLLVVIGVCPVMAAELPGSSHIWINVANDAGVKYDWDGAYYGTGNNNTYYIKFEGGGLNQLWMSTDTSSYQVTTTPQQSGTFYVRTTGGRGSNDDIILLLSVQDPIPDDFSVRIKSSGYTWTPPTSGAYNPSFPPSGATYVDNVIDETFTKADFIYGPQTWKPAGSSGKLQLYAGQDISDASTMSHLMFIDLNVGNLKTATVNNGAAKVEYSFTNMASKAAFNSYAWASASNQNEGISWTNLPSGSGYIVTGVPYAAFTYATDALTTPLAVRFTDTSSGSPTTWAWDFNNDGVTESTEQSPVYTFPAAGRYIVKLTATNTAGSGTATRIIDVSETGPVTAPEFPTVALPVALLVGMLGAVLFIQRTKEN